MILVASQTPRERAAFAALFEVRGWPTLQCDSTQSMARILRRSQPRAVLTRHRLADGYSDDVITLLREAGLLPETKIIVLAAAGTTATAEARQITLGADCLLRDPVRTDVLLAYLFKYCQRARSTPRKSARECDKAISFSGATVRPADRLLQYDRQSISLTRREVELIELLVQSRGKILTYDSLYHEILCRHFTGDTSNMRVLLGKLTRSAARVGIILRQWVEVIPKTGYRYRRTLPRALRAAAVPRRCPQPSEREFAPNRRTSPHPPP